MITTLARFVLGGSGLLFRGGRLYWSWIALLWAAILLGGVFYVRQVMYGLIVTGMSDQVSWGAYIANFTYLVGVAAAGVMLVIPAYVFHREDIKHVVLIGEGAAVAAVVMAMLFVVVDLGRPDRLWHMIPLLGRFNFPASMLAWDVFVLNGYLLLNLGIPFYILFAHYRGREARVSAYFPWVLLSIVWAIAIHTVTAFLFSSNAGRPFWHTAILGPRFLASAFTSGPALILLSLQVIERVTPFRVRTAVIDFLAIVVTIALQINLFLVGVELFTEFYASTEESHSATYLYFGLHGARRLVPWIWTAIGLNLVAVVVLTIHALRGRRWLLNGACALAIVGVWIEKGMGLIVPGFTPTPLGEILEYAPTASEFFVSVGIWAVGILVFTLLTKVAVAVELGQLRDGGGVAK